MTDDIASTRADEMRRAWADRTPHEIHQANLAAFRADIDKGHPWIPGAAFIACPGLAEHLYAAFADWVSNFDPNIYTYRSVTQDHVVTWTRDENGVWHADDGRDMTATDDDIRQAREVVMRA